MEPTDDGLPYRIKQMADEIRAMQETIYDLPLPGMRAYIELLEKQAIRLSKLASLLYSSRAN